MKYHRYDKYKETGVTWLGKMPENWDVKRIKYLASCNDETLGETTDPDMPINYVDISSVDLISGIKSSEELTFEKSPSRARRIVRDGDTIISTVRTYLKAIAPIREPIENLIVSTGFAVIRPRKNLHPDYLGYCLQSEGFLGEVVAYSNGVSYPAINPTDLIGLPIPAPPHDQQKAIASFLDEKTAEIDALIAKKEELLLKLAEKRAAMITHAVTKGLNPSAPMKDSGIDWLGQIPAHWDMKRFKFSALSVNQKIEQDLVDAPYMGLEHVESWTGKRIADDESKSEGIVSVFRKNDVLFGKLRPYLAKIYLADEAGCSSTEFLNLRAKKNLEPSYLKYYLLNKDFIDLVDGSTYGAKMPRASWDFIGNQFILLPPNAEQKLIADFLDNKTAEMDKTAHTIKNAIYNLKEYRSALITNAVTGKIKVA